MNNIKSERTRLNLTQSELGKRVSVDAATIGRWEAEGSNIPSSKAIEMASLFGCSVDYLFGLCNERTYTTR